MNDLPKRGWPRAILGLLLTLGLTIGGAHLFEPRPEPVQFNRKLLRSLTTQKPELALIGDSMLLTRLASERLAKLSGLRVRSIAPQGSASARWYLILKNFLLPLEPPPKFIIVFFRDTYIIQPRYRTTGQYWKELEREMIGEEPVLQEKLFKAQTFLEYLGAFVDEQFPLGRHSEQLRKELRSKVYRAVRGRGSYETFEEIIAKRFSIEKIRGDIGSDLPEQTIVEDFSDEIARSFVPEMLRLSKERGVQLIFHRVKRRGRAAGNPDPPEVVQFLSQFRAYVTSAGGAVTDESNDPRLTLDMYSDGDHLRRDRRNDYTKIFWEHLAPELRQ